MARAWWRCLGAGALVCLLYPFLDGRAEALAFPLVGVGSLVAMLFGVVVHRPERPLVWWLLGSALVLFMVGDALHSADHSRDVHTISPGTVDALYLLAYVLLFVAAGLLARRAAMRDRAAVLDASIWTLGALSVAWLPLLAPYVHDASLTTWQQLVALAYPSMDLGLLLMLVHQLSSHSRRGPTHRLVMGGLLAMLCSDVAFGLRSLSGDYQAGELTDVGWLAAYVALAAAALHPNMAGLTAPAVPAQMSTERRTVALLVPALAGPALIVALVARGDLASDPAGVLLAASCTAVVFLLCLVRARGHVRVLRGREALLVATLRDRERLEHELRSRATRCDLTGLVNRAGFGEVAAASLAEDAVAHVAVLDLDDFKAVNDALGHDAGDAVLVQVADRLARAVGPRDVVGRLGGGEFALLLRGDAAAAVADLLAALGVVLRVGEHELRVSASVGLVRCEPGTTVGDLLRRADVAMYAAKGSGGDRARHYTPDMGSSLLLQLDLRSKLAAAVRNDEVLPWFQPVVDLDSGELVGFEALARWVRPGGAVLPPSGWMELAEQSGLVVPLDVAMLRASLAELARWRAELPGASSLHLAVNASGRTLQDPTFAATVLALLATHGVPADRLVLEVTEGVLIDDEQVGSRLQELRVAGVRIALDDFGTGWSSLSYLSRFPVDVLKLDRTFTERLGLGPTGEAVPSAVVHLARALGLEVVAEGIEQDTQARRLVELGAHRGQGYLYGRPVPSASAYQLVADRGGVATVA
jgi:diguanylate cyclase (GGDEF)-like protein